MAIYHFSMKTISRSHGRSATAAIAYRAGEKITDRRTGEVHDYQKKSGVLGTGIILPSGAPEWAKSREQLWNAVEQKETRKNSTVAREIIVALPTELNKKAQFQMVHDFAERLVKRHKCAVDFAIHEPNKQGDERNYHAHILMSTRRLTADGFTEKTRELDERNSGEIEHWREEWANHVNQRLAEHGHSERISHLSLAEQGIDREPTKHKGVAATAIERKKQTEIKANPDLNLMEKSRQFKAERTQISELYEPISGYDFGIKSQQSYDIYTDFLDFDIQRQEVFLHELVAERERLLADTLQKENQENPINKAKAVYQEKLGTLNETEQAKARMYEQMALLAVSRLPAEMRERTVINLYLNQADLIHDGKYNAPDPMKSVERQSEKAHEPKHERAPSRDDWDMER